jgi:hypothetical protein
VANLEVSELIFVERCVVKVVIPIIVVLLILTSIGAGGRIGLRAEDLLRGELSGHGELPKLIPASSGNAEPVASVLFERQRHLPHTSCEWMSLVNHGRTRAYFLLLHFHFLRLALLVRSHIQEPATEHGLFWRNLSVRRDRSGVAKLVRFAFLVKILLVIGPPAD